MLATNNSNRCSKECLTFTVANVVVIGNILSYALIRMRKNSLVPHCADTPVGALTVNSCVGTSVFSYFFQHGQQPQQLWNKL